MAETFVNNYHVFSLCLPNGGEDILSFDVMRHNFPNGYQSSAMFGSSAGLRSWKLPFDGLPQFAPLHTFRGKDYNRVEYIRALFTHQVTTGTPFVIESPVNGQYYLAMFDEDSNSLSRKLTAVWNTNINLRQVRIEGVSVFDIDALPGIYGHYSAISYDGDFNDNDPLDATNWADSAPGNNFLGGIDGVTYQTDEQNGLPVVRFNGTNGLFYKNEAVTIYEAFFVMKIDEATLSGYQGILTDSTAVSALVTNNTGTIALNQSFNLYEYRKNSILFPQTASELPMNVFGLVHIRFQGGIPLNDVQIGQNKSESHFLGGDIGEIVLCDQLLSETDSREVTEDLMKRWNL